MLEMMKIWWFYTLFSFFCELILFCRVPRSLARSFACLLSRYHVKGAKTWNIKIFEWNDMNTLSFLCFSFPLPVHFFVQFLFSSKFFSSQCSFLPFNFFIFIFLFKSKATANQFLIHLLRVSILFLCMLPFSFLTCLFFPSWRCEFLIYVSSITLIISP